MDGWTERQTGGRTDPLIDVLLGTSKPSNASETASVKVSDANKNVS